MNQKKLVLLYFVNYRAKNYLIEPFPECYGVAVALIILNGMAYLRRVIMYNLTFIWECAMKKHLSLVAVALVCASNLSCDDQKPDQVSSPNLVPVINGKNILDAIKDASRSSEYIQARLRVKSESEKTYNILFEQIKHKLNAEEQAYVRGVLLAVQDFHTRLHGTIDLMNNTPVEQRNESMQIEIVKLNSELTKIGALLAPLMRVHEQRTPEENADYEAWGFEIMNSLISSMKQFTDVGLSKFSDK